MGKVMGVLPSTLKSKALWVYFQMYSPLTTTFLPKACCRLAWNSLRKPGSSVPETPGVQSEQRRQHRIRAAAAGEHQVFVEWRLQGARVGDCSARCWWA